MGDTGVKQKLVILCVYDEWNGLKGRRILLEHVQPREEYRLSHAALLPHLVSVT
jgi:hypothetical protein